ncbi:hypothetical protein EUX98_g7558 [Antrodiella citrinella]|uniref:EH domain-containing protein n=1 Tax=Antrodiella citrinella TaxID=2447956 RepID=A0A4S4ML77_9APHY|nr:hypothetical protein EUX98_g7558 [Antrodiella citrinella]
MRSLTLHVSALNDSEYDYFTSSFSDLLDDPNAQPIDDVKYDSLTVSTREARAWLRGRYSAVAVADLDAILRTISPNNEALSGGQFFAVMRLITHVAAGKEVDGGLVFVQCHPSDFSPLSRAPKLPPPPPHHPAHETKKTAPAPPLPVKRQPPPRPANHAPPQSETDAVVVIPPSVPPKPTNPFLNRSKSHEVSTLNSPVTAVRTKTTGAIEGKQPPLPPRKPVAPPPPPRHVSSSFIPPPFPSTGTTNALIQQSLQAGRIAQSLKKAEERLQKERVMEVLKTSTTKRNRSISPTKDLSSDASASSSSGSGYASTDRPPPVLPPRRAFSPETSPRLSVRSLDQVATATVGYKPRYPTSSPFAREQSSERYKPPPPPPLPIRSPSRSPPKPNVDLSPESPTSTISQPPPTHPDRKSVAQQVQDWSDGSNPPSPNTRLFRSKSLHQQSPQLPPPLRRKRPESVQITPTEANGPSLPSSPARPSTTRHHSALSRHLSLSSPAAAAAMHGERAPSSMSDSPIAGLQKTFNNLHQRAQPKLDAARYKAEAGLTKRGFVSHGGWMREEGEERLIDEPDDMETNHRVLGSGPFERSQDDLDVSEISDVERSWEERLRSLRGSQSHTGHLSRGDGGGGGSSGREKEKKEDKVKDRTWLFDRDEMKWPAGEGWKPL